MSTTGIANRYNGKSEKEDFFSLVKHYEKSFVRACKEQGVDFSKIGEDGSPGNEALRFKSIGSLGFSLDKIKEQKDTEHNGLSQYDYMVSFMGLLGTAGVLPQHYTTLSLERNKYGDSALSEFIGLFEHRLISLYYKSLGKYKLPFQFENVDANEEDSISRSLRCFSGAYNYNPVQLYYSGHYAKNTRPLSNLRSLLKDLVKAKVSIQSMVGSWLPIAKRDRCRIGRHGANHRLGDGVLLGKRYWDIQSKIIICFHDIDIKKFNELEVEKPLYRLLSDAVNAYVPSHISVGFEFYVNCHLNELKTLGKGVRLSTNTWLASKKENLLLSKRELVRN